ncbi:MAG: VIT1/CCC1 transporter family protein [Pseudomonadota bacterium]
MENLEHSHHPEAIRERLLSGAKPNYLRDWVYGGIDGAVTTFAIVAGVVGASLPSSVIIILGLANLFADGFSMAAGNYSGSKSEIDDFRRLEEIERRHIRVDPDGEKEEIRQILAEKGLSGQTLNDAVELIARKEQAWIDIMMSEEYGLGRTQRDPLTAAMATFAAFVLCGAVPLLPFFLPVAGPFTLAIVMTSLVFFAIGAVKSRWSLTSWWVSGTETFLIGTAAAAVAYGIGFALKEITGISI